VSPLRELMYYGIVRVDDILLNLVAMSELGRLKKFDWAENTTECHLPGPFHHVICLW
jgi:hypothetical protein